LSSDYDYPHRQKICDGKLYSIKSETAGTKRLLIVSGDGGVWVLDWDKDIDLQQTDPQRPSPTVQFKTHPSPLESQSIEINDIQILEGRYLFGAAGDSFGVYKWDIESAKLVSNYMSPGTSSSGYLHSIQLVPGEGNSPPSTLLAGGEGGVVEFWDVQKDAYMENIDLTAVSAADTAASSTTTTSRAPKRSRTSASRWISSICALDSNWFTVAGGNSGSSSAHKTSSGNGFLATYHQPTRSLVSFAETRETPQQLAVLPVAAESSVQHSLISVANEGIVSHYNALSLEISRKQWSSPPSSYAVAVSSDQQYSAIAGVGAFVDIFDSAGEKTLRLSIC
jgi:hypothetical protein